MIDYKKLIAAGLQYGHVASRWCPAMKSYIWGEKNNIHLIDISKTARGLEKAAQFLESVAKEGQTIVWVGTKKVAREPIRAAVSAVKAQSGAFSNPYVVHRWIGGLFTNFSQVKKSVTKLLHYEDVLARSEQFSYTKKELNSFQKIARKLESNVGGIRSFAWPVGAVVIIDIKKEQAALNEASRMGIPVVALVDTNSDPALVDYVIPGNDDAPKAVQFVVEYLAQAAQRGYAVATQNRKDASVQAASDVEQPVVVVHDDESGEEESTTAKRTAPMGKSQARRPVRAKRVQAEERE